MCVVIITFCRAHIGSCRGKRPPGTRAYTVDSTNPCCVAGSTSRTPCSARASVMMAPRPVNATHSPSTRGSTAYHKHVLTLRFSSHHSYILLRRKIMRKQRSRMFLINREQRSRKWIFRPLHRYS